MVVEVDQMLAQEFTNNKFSFGLHKELPLNSFSDFDPTTIELYQHQSKIRKSKLKNLVDNSGWLMLYSVLVPEVFCKDLVRLGNVGDGGKWVCNPIHVRNFDACTVYSLGVRNEPSFEEEFARFTHNKCIIRSVDKSDQTPQTLERIKNSNGMFMKGLISSEVNKSMNSYNLKSLLEIFNDGKIDILKIDIEGFEYEIIDELVTTPICQILIEVHGKTPMRTIEFLRKLSQSGYYLFSYEINGGHTTLSEYSFIHQNCLNRYGVNIIFGRYLS